MGVKFSLTEEQCKLRGERLKRNWKDPEFKAKIKKSLSEVEKTEEWREKMRQAKLGVPKSEDHKANMTKSHHLRCRTVSFIKEHYHPELKWHDCQKLHYMADKEKWTQLYLDSLNDETSET